MLSALRHGQASGRYRAVYIAHRGDQLVFRVNARTVLELGSELISSDIIAFYELIKNAFDAGSRTGADVHFRIALRRNDYLRIRDEAESFAGQVRKLL